MKNMDKAKRKAAKQRLKRIKEYYKAYDFGDRLYNNKHEKHIVVLKKEYNGQFYFVVQDQFGYMSLQKFSDGIDVHLVNISRDGRQYAQNCTVFDSWFKEAETKINRYVKDYYFATKFGTQSDRFLDERYKLVLKKEYNGKYYFVLKSESGKYRVAKLVWFNGISTVVIPTGEFNSNIKLFSSWINEAKMQGK